MQESDLRAIAATDTSAADAQRASKAEEDLLALRTDYDRLEREIAEVHAQVCCTLLV